MDAGEVEGAAAGSDVEGADISKWDAFRRLTRGVRGKVLLVVGVTSAALGFAGNAVAVVDAGAAVIDKVRATPPRLDDARLDRPLTASETPVPGSATGILGFGDSIGGRPTIPYLGTEAVPTVPVLNAFTDLPSNEDERRFVLASRIPSVDVPLTPRDVDYGRHVSVGESGLIAVLVRMDNNAEPPPDCDVLEHRSTARNLHVRLADWTDKRTGEHVLRAWVSTDNSEPRWVTDAVLIDAPSPGSFAVARARIYRKAPSVDKVPLSGAEQLFEPGGAQIGDGLLGGCWDNRYALNVVLRFEPAGS